MISVRKAFIGLFLLIPAALFAQSYHGEVRGLVTDPSHLVVNNAKVTLIDEARKVQQEAVSDSAGQYDFARVDPATYQVVVEAPNFKRFSREGIVVGTQQSVTVDVALSIGDTAQTIEVTSDTPLLDTTSGSTSTALEDHKLVDLPTSANNGRNQYTVINVSQNVLPVIRGSGSIDQSDISTVSIAGSPESTNQYLVDGIPITDTVNRPVIIPASEATQELKVQVTTYDVEVGRTGGGVYNTLLKSGTNALHGSLYGVTSPTTLNTMPSPSVTLLAISSPRASPSRSPASGRRSGRRRRAALRGARHRLHQRAGRATRQRPHECADCLRADPAGGRAR